MQYLIEMVHLVLLNRPSKPICVANMLVALMDFAVVREQQIWIYDYEIGFFFIIFFYLFCAVGVNVEAMDAYSWPTPGP